jgi:hypothetical protein
LPSLPSVCYRLATNAPVVCIHLIYYHDCGCRILPQNFDEEVGYSFDEFSLLISGNTLLGYFDIYIRHDSSLFSPELNSNFGHPNLIMRPLELTEISYSIYLAIFELEFRTALESKYFSGFHAVGAYLI